MPVYRTPDGKIVEEKTVKEDETEQKDLPPPPPADEGDEGEEMGAGFDAPTQRISEKPEAPADEEAEAGEEKAAASKEGEKAEQDAGKAAEKKADEAKPAGDGDDDRTRLAGARPRKKKPASEAADEEAPVDAMDDPLVGWLVVTDGPGQGSGIRLGYGANTIGRAGTMRVQLDFGDGQISRDKHAIVTYDPRSRKWFVQHGGGKNLTYVNGAPVLQATELASSDEVQLGDTTLRLVPFCGPDFDWQDKEESS